MRMNKISHKKMPKISSSQINFQSLLVSRVREKSVSLTLGIIIFLFAAAFVITNSLPKLRPILSKAVSPDSEKSKSEKIVPTKKIRMYTVQPGDTLFLIAEKIYGSGLNLQDIMEANKLTNPDQIEVGQKLIIPDVKPRYPTTGSITDSSVQTGQVTERSEKYIVKDGDDLAKIALETYGDSYAWTRIAEANNLLNPNDLRTGMILLIPR